MQHGKGQDAVWPSKLFTGPVFCVLDKHMLHRVASTANERIRGDQFWSCVKLYRESGFARVCISVAVNRGALREEVVAKFLYNRAWASFRQR